MYDQQLPWTPPGGGAIAVTTRYSWLAFVLALFRPYLAINGQPVPATWGRTVVPLAAGTHHVYVHVPYLLPPRVGIAEARVPVQPGQVTEVEYRAPVIAWIGGAIGPAPQRFRGLSAGIALLVVPMVALFCVTGSLVAVGLTAGGREVTPVTLDTPRAPTRPTSVPTTAPTREPLPGTEPTTGAPGDEPTLRPARDRTLVGPSYAAGDETYTMGLRGFPFAFRTPPTWGCLRGKVDIPDATAWVCVDEGKPFDAGAPAPDRGKRLQIMVRPCPAPCGQAVRDEMSTDWFDDGAKATTVDERTAYVETAVDGEGRYTLDMSHFFPATGTSRWQVAVGTHSQPDSRDVVQRIVNDILTQAG